MSFFQDLQVTLDTRLNSLAGGTPIAWENVTYTPVKGTAYLRPTLLLADAVTMELDGTQMQEGIYQVDVFYPTGNGNGTLLAKQDAIYDHFKGSTTLSSGSGNVYIHRIGRTGSVAVADGWLMGSIEIHFKHYET